MVRISERPLHRSAIKFLATVLLGRANAHAQNWWPGLALDAPADPAQEGHVVYREEEVAQLLHPLALKAQAGRDVFIIGSGPSVKENDISAIGSFTAILLNGSVSLIGCPIERPLAIAIEDERFIWRHFDLVRTKVEKGMFCLFSVGVLRAICEIDHKWLGDKRIVLIDDIRKPYREARRSSTTLVEFDFAHLSADRGAGFSDDPSRGVFQGGSVAVSALQFAVYCAPERIGFFGIDIANADSTPRFYERTGWTAKSGIARARARILAHIELAKQVCDEKRIELLNFSRMSALQDCGLAYDARYARAAIEA